MNSTEKEVVICGVGILTSGVENKDDLRFLYNCERDDERFQPSFVNGRSYKGYYIRRSEKLDGALAKYKRIPDAYRYALYAVANAINNAPLELQRCNKDRIGLFFSTGLSAIGAVEKYLAPVCSVGIEKGSPIKFPDTTASVGCGQVAIHNGITGKALAISSAGVAGFQGIDQAIDSLRDGELDYAIVVGTDELTDAVSEAFYRTGMISKKSCECRPYEKRSNTTILGEGAAALILKLREDEDNGNVIKSIEGGNYNYSDESCYEVFADIVSSGIESSGLSPNDIDIVVTAGNGNKIMDSIEEKALLKVFGDNTDVKFVCPAVFWGELDGTSSIANCLCADDMLSKNEIMNAVFIEKEKELKEKKKIKEKSKKDISNILVVSSSFFGDVYCAVIGR